MGAEAVAAFTAGNGPFVVHIYHLLLDIELMLSEIKHTPLAVQVICHVDEIVDVFGHVLDGVCLQVPERCGDGN